MPRRKLVNVVGKNTRQRWRQARWLLWYFLSKESCCFCGKMLFDGFEGGGVNVTLHHLKGDQKTDKLSEKAPVKHLRPAHASCHKANHIRERMAAKGSKAAKAGIVKVESIEDDSVVESMVDSLIGTIDGDTLAEFVERGRKLIGDDDDE